MSKKIRVGAVSCQSVVNDTAGNMAVINEWIAKAQETKVNLLLFPELCVTGYSTTCDLAALNREHPACRELARISQEANMVLSVGMAWQDDNDARKYLAHCLWLPDGECYIYRKTHLGAREKNMYTAGNILPVFALPQARVGVQLCLEHHFPEVSQTLVLKGAELILCPHAIPRLTPEERREKWHISLRARAYDNCVYILAANQVGSNGKGMVYPGGLMLVDPSGKVVAEDFSGEPAIITADINLTNVISLRTTPHGMCRRFYAADRRPELYE